MIQNSTRGVLTSCKCACSPSRSYACSIRAVSATSHENTRAHACWLCSSACRSPGVPRSLPSLLPTPLLAVGACTCVSRPLVFAAGGRCSRRPPGPCISRRYPVYLDHMHLRELQCSAAVCVSAARLQERLPVLRGSDVLRRRRCRGVMHEQLRPPRVHHCRDEQRSVQRRPRLRHVRQRLLHRQRG